MRNTLLLLAFCSAPLLCGQSGPDHRPTVADGTFAFGGGTALDPSTTLDGWRSALPGSEILAGDIPGSGGSRYSGSFGPYEDGPFGQYAGSSSGTAFVSIGLDLGRGTVEPSKYEKRLRIGVSYTGIESSSNAWGRTSTARYDTLVSQSTGALYFRDTTYAEQYVVSASWSRIGLDVSYTIRRANTSRWAWYLGVGGQAGATLNTEANVSQWISRSELNSDVVQTTALDQERSEYYNLGSDLWGAAYALGGLDFQLSRKSPFLSSVHLFYELRPTILFGAPANLPATAQGSMGSLFGLRFDLR